MPDDATTHFVLRPLEKSDLETITRWFQDVDDLALFDRSSRVPYDLPSCERLWDPSSEENIAGKRFWFAITSDTNEVNGLVGLENISSVNRDAVIPLYVDKATRRKGVGIRASALVLDFGFRQLGLQRITSYYRADNIGSRDLTRMAGFEIEGRMRHSWFADGTFHDMVVVGLLHDEWNARRDALAAELGTDTVITFGGTGSSKWVWPPQAAGSA